MQTKISFGKQSNLLNFLILLFPVLNILVAYVQKGNGLLILYVCYSCIIFVIVALQHKSQRTLYLNKSVFICIVVLILEAFFTGIIAGRIDAVLQYITFAFCVIYWLIFSDEQRIISFEHYLMEKKKAIFGLQFIYLVILLMTVIWGDGINNGGWGTISLKGPYLINHLLAYELLAFLMINIFIWIRESTIIPSILIVLYFGLILLTGVRSALLAAVLVVGFVFMTQKPQKKLVFGILAVIIFLIMFYQTHLFTALLEKTQNSIELGSASGGRQYIFKSSIDAYLEAENPAEWLVGVGYDNLLNYNLEHIRMKIHAHNDFLDALVQYGLIGLFIYLWSLRKFLTSGKRKTWVAGLSIVLVLAVFNGYYMYQSIVVMCPVIMAFSRSVKIKRRGERNVSP